MSGYLGYILRILLILRVVYILLILRVPYILYLCNLCPIMSFAYDCRIILDDWIFVIFIICLSFDSLSLVSRICRWGFLKWLWLFKTMGFNTKRISFWMIWSTPTWGNLHITFRTLIFSDLSPNHLIFDLYSWAKKKMNVTNWRMLPGQIITSLVDLTTSDANSGM